MTMLPVYVRELDFEDWLEQSKDIERVTGANISHFAKLLSTEEDFDSYVTSPAYYVFTGRRGLWTYRHGETCVPLCWHPNVDGQILIFPPRGKKNFAAITALLDEIAPPPMGFLLARFKQEDIIHLKTFDAFLHRASFTPVMEETLDWSYPARVLSTERTAEMQGHEYMHVRNRVRQTKKYQLDVGLFSPGHVPEIEALTYRWANRQSENPHELSNLMAPYKEILRLVKHKNLDLTGLVFSINGQIQAATIWDISNAKNCTANVYINLCNVMYRGLSEFSVKTTAETLYAQGIQYMNLGGSETAGLDRYKKKFVPAYSIDLCSLEATINDARFVVEAPIVTKELGVAS